MKIGLFFGSFNPVHVGHMVLANYMLEFTDMERLWFIVSPHNPHKQKSSLLNERDRLHLVNLAIGDNIKMKASDIEFGLPQPSYTINTLAYLEEKYPEHTFVLIMGADNLETFHKWKNYDQILERFELYVYPRPGHPAVDMMKHPRVKLVNAPLMEISSTFLRNAIKNKTDVAAFFPEAVWKYTREMHFYEK
ncbi:MAG: nicotinate (nicotinamide) nucleotide adenylyltransferase [Bacteroidota bacterium]|nr:nicotinate (nicotinamide) nucleotide adenylyltransferase [Bacteroidota bacterium]